MSLLLPKLKVLRITTSSSNVLYAMEKTSAISPLYCIQWIECKGEKTGGFRRCGGENFVHCGIWWREYIQNRCKYPLYTWKRYNTLLWSNVNCRTILDLWSKQYNHQKIIRKYFIKIPRLSDKPCWRSIHRSVYILHPP